jgi:outer membrane receptor protein involved in Fe transport
VIAARPPFVYITATDDRAFDDEVTKKEKTMLSRNKPGTIFSVCLHALILTLAFLISAPVFSQIVGGTLSGTVTDSSGAAIPNATIAIKNVATGVTTNAASNAQGLYSAPNLLPGTYEATVTATGFDTKAMSDVVLTVGAQQVLNFSMKVGTISEKVQVSEIAPDLQLVSSTISGVIDSTTVLQLPLNARSWTDLAILQPGVNTIRHMVNVGTPDRLGRGLGEELSIAGGRPQQNNYLLDGTSVNDYSNQAPGSVLGGNLGVDAVSEFKVLTTNFSTEYGRSSGGVISAITRSGTNTFHGSAYEFLRNSALDGRNFFDGPIPAFRRNQFGASAGGPIRKGKTFIFGDYEGLRQSLALSNQDQVPSLAIRGVGTGPGGGPGPSMVCSNPAGADPSSPCTTQTLAQFAAASSTPFTVPNPDPVTGIDTAVLPYLGFYPLPNGPVIGNGDAANFSFAGRQITTENFFTTRLDQQFSSKDNLALIYLFDNTPSSQTDEFNNKLILSKTRRQVATLEENHLFSARVVNTFRIGYSRIVAGSPSGATANNPLAANTSLGFLPGNTTGAILGVPGLTDFTGGLSVVTPGVFHWNSYQAYDNVSLTKGIHSLTFGFNVERIQDIETGCGNCGGNYTFNSIPEFLGNQPLKLIAQFNPLTNHMFETIFGAFVQDNIRLRPNLTINAGLRYEMATVPTEAKGEDGSLHSLDGARMFNGNPLFHNPSLRNFEPRVGFAWDPFHTGKTSIRGGFGMFDVLIFPPNLRSALNSAYPFALGLSGSNLAPGSFPTGAVASLSAGTGTTAQRGSFIQQNPGRNYVMQWNVNVQREIARNTTVMVAYVGSRGVHNLLVTDDSSIVLPLEKSAEGYLWPIPDPTRPVLNPNWGRVSSSFWNSDSHYHAIEVSLTQRMSHGLTAQVSYTHGSSIDTSSGSTDGDQFLNGLSSLPFFSESLRKGPSEFNVPNNFTASYTWDLPNPKSLSGVLGWASSGWELGGIFTAQNGTPFTPIIGGDPLGMNSTDPFDYPNLVPGCNPIHGGVNYLNLNCFALPMATPDIAAMCVPFGTHTGTCSNLVGNAGRNSLIGPRLVNLDFSLFKNNPIKRISEQFNVQFRVEFFNIFNHTNFNAPTGNNANTIFDGGSGDPVGGAGVASSTVTTSRQIQFALKFVW